MQQGRTRKEWLVRIATCYCILMITSRSSGQEDAGHESVTPDKCSRIWIAPIVPNNQSRWVPEEPIVIEALIIDHTSEHLVYAKVGDSSTREMKGDQVVAIEVAWGSEEAAEASRLFRRGEHRKSISETMKTRGKKLLPWQQRALLACNIDSLRWVGMMDKAGEEFIRLSKYQPPTLLFASMPLLWSNETLDRKSLEAAQGWIKETDEVPRLIGASWLLSGNQRSDAIETLEGLTKSKSQTIKQLAATQLWRTVPAGEVASHLQPKWSAARDSMPYPLQWGPTMLLANKLDQSGNSMLAVPEWLRIASLYPDRYDAAKMAIQKATDVLTKAGKATDVIQIKTHFSTIQEESSASSKSK